MTPRMATAPLADTDTEVALGLATAPPRQRARRGTPAHGGEGHVAAPVIWREALQRRLLAMGDVLASIAAILIGITLFHRAAAAPTALAGGALAPLLFKMAGLYDRDDLRLVHSTLDEVPLLVQLTGLFALGIGLVQALTPTGSASGEEIAVLWFVAATAIIGARVLTRAVANRTSPVERCMVIGEPHLVDRIRGKLAASGTRAVVVASIPLDGLDLDADDWQLVPQIIDEVVSDLSIHRIIIAPSSSDSTGVVELIRTAKAVGVRVSLLPRMLEVVGSAVQFDDIDGMTMLGMRKFGLPRSSRLLKRALDLAVGSLVLVLVSPVIAAIAFAIQLESRGPVFFRQTRVGRDGSHFQIVKFRSMVVDAERQKDTLRARNEAGDGLFKIRDDPRITRVGRVLRSTSLDELPQLFNVLCGEMSLVGPRPLVVDEDMLVFGLDRSRLHLTPGMTGPWQILGARVPMQEMVGIDYLYVANWTMWLDLKLLVRTVRHVTRRGNL